MLLHRNRKLNIGKLDMKPLRNNYLRIYLLNRLINISQTGYIAGRYIGKNIRLLYDTMHYAEGNDISGMLNHTYYVILLF